MSVAKPGSANRSSQWRGEDDDFPTPIGATWALCDAVDLPERVWEPACGAGAMARVLSARGHDVVATTLVDYGFGHAGRDFLQETELLAPAIVTNPPFAIADDFADHALNLGPDLLCLLLRLKWLEGRRRYGRILRDRPPSSVHVFVERVKFYAGSVDRAAQPSWNTEAFAWFVWSSEDVGRSRAPSIGWVHREPDPKPPAYVALEMLSQAPSDATEQLDLSL